MTAYFRCTGSIDAELVADMSAAFDEAFGTSGGSYPVKEWADDTNLLGPIPTKTKTGTNSVSFSDSLAMPLKSLKGTLASRVNTTELTDLGLQVQHGASVNVYSFHLSRAIVGGEVDFLNGSVDHVYLRGDVTAFRLLSNEANASGIIVFSWAWGGMTPTKAAGTTNVRSNLFATKNTQITQDATEEGISGGTGSGVGMYIAILASRLSGDLSTRDGRSAAFKQWATDNGLVVDYEADLSSFGPVIFTPLNNHETDSISGSNTYLGTGSNTWDSFEVEYYFDISTLGG